jgi:hypothetical protein
MSQDFEAARCVTQGRRENSPWENEGKGEITTKPLNHLPEDRKGSKYYSKQNLLYHLSLCRK